MRADVDAWSEWRKKMEQWSLPPLVLPLAIGPAIVGSITVNLVWYASYRR
jgi:hypothetical protein